MGEARKKEEDRWCHMAAKKLTRHSESYLLRVVLMRIEQAHPLNSRSDVIRLSDNCM